MIEKGRLRWQFILMLSKAFSASAFKGMQLGAILNNILFDVVKGTFLANVKVNQKHVPV